MRARFNYWWTFFVNIFRRCHAMNTKSKGQLNSRSFHHDGATRMTVPFFDSAASDTNIVLVI
jgi:hypothetical protein